MAKWKRTNVGSVCKDSKDKTKSYIKFSRDVEFKKGDIINLESADEQMASLQEAVVGGKISEDFAQKIKERIEKIPDWVRFELVHISKNEE